MTLVGPTYREQIRGLYIEVHTYLPERALLAPPQGKLHRECSVRPLTPRQLLGIPGLPLPDTAAGDRLVRDAQALLLPVERKFPAMFVSFN